MKILKVTFILSFVCVSCAWGFRTENFGNAGHHSDGWEGINIVLDDVHRVYTVDFDGHTDAYFRGNTYALNESLRRFSEFECETHEVEIRPGPSAVRSIDKQRIAYDWHVSVSGAFDELKIKLGKRTGAFGHFPIMRIDVHESSNINLEQLLIPSNVTVLQVDDLQNRYREGMTNEDSRVRGEAVTRLAWVNPRDESSVLTIVELMTDPDELVRIRAAHALGVMGKLATSTLPLLRQELQSDSDKMRDARRYAIDRIESSPEHTVEPDEILVCRKTCVLR